MICPVPSNLQGSLLGPPRGGTYKCPLSLRTKACSSQLNGFHIGYSKDVLGQTVRLGGKTWVICIASDSGAQFSHQHES